MGEEGREEANKKKQEEEITELDSLPNLSCIFNDLDSSVDRHEDVRLLMNRHQPSCICLQEVMLENNEYNLGQEYKFHETIPLGRRSKGGIAIAE